MASLVGAEIGAQIQVVIIERADPKAVMDQIVLEAEGIKIVQGGKNLPDFSR